MKLNLWLDSTRGVPTFIESGLVWTLAKTGDEAIEILQTGNVEFASLDHDLATGSEDPGIEEKTGWDVMTWMTENNVWPKTGVRIHAANGDRRGAMISLVKRVYGRTFQYPCGELPSPSVDIPEEEDAASANGY